jgi:hypothetical protein
MMSLLVAIPNMAYKGQRQADTTHTFIARTATYKPRVKRIYVKLISVSHKKMILIFFVFFHRHKINKCNGSIGYRPLRTGDGSRKCCACWLPL